MIKKLIRILKQLAHLKSNVLLVKNIYSRSLLFHYRGIQTSKFPFDLLNYQMILHKTKPDLVIEIGSHLGGSALFLADFMYLYDRSSEVHTIDVYQSISEPLVIDNPRIKIFTEGWEKYSLDLTSRFKKIMVIDDGSHHSEDVFQALLKFSPIINPGMYYIVEDGIVTSLGVEAELQLKGGPLEGIAKFKRFNLTFSRDLEIEEFWGKGTTANHSGYLLKGTQNNSVDI